MVRLQALVADPELVAAARAAEPDLAGCGSALEAAEAELEAAAAELTLAGSRVSALRELADELTVRLETLAPLLERRALVRGVASLADGSSAANRLRMPLSAYVLTARLEQIAEAASVRLERMSGGRYLLAHCDERVGRSRKGGLGLEVHDAWTGRERPPSSLSGGETFQASLALALGLADVVSAEAGGARLETLFVDEGFGTLGDRALDDVLDVLDGLREGGRAVGVISHVSEMRQRIPVQLHVEKGREGSRIRQR
jgi:exonuclease SbcC